MEQKYCKHCGNLLSDGTTICIQCGFDGRTGNRYCGHCGKNVEPEQVLCVNCGYMLNEAESKEKTEDDNSHLRKYEKCIPAVKKILRFSIVECCVAFLCFFIFLLLPVIEFLRFDDIIRKKGSLFLIFVFFSIVFSIGMVIWATKKMKETLHLDIDQSAHLLYDKIKKPEELVFSWKDLLIPNLSVGIGWLFVLLRYIIVEDVNVETAFILSYAIYFLLSLAHFMLRRREDAVIISMVETEIKESYNYYK